VPAEAYIKFFKKGFEGESLRKLKSDGLRWRWWRLCGLSDYETFPGLVSKGLAPLTEAEIIGLLYKSQEFNGRVDKITLWRQEKEALIASGLVRSCILDGKEYLWNANFHSHQDKYSRKGAQLGEKFYSSFPKLNEHDKAVFIMLLSKFQPQDVELSVFGIPEFIPQFDAFVNRKFPLFGGSVAVPNGTIKHLMVGVTDKVQQFFATRKTEGQSDTKEFVEWYCKTYQDLRKGPYLRGGKDYRLVADMLKVFSLSELEKMAERFLKEEDAFVKKAGYTIGVFKTMVNRLVMTKERRPIGVGDFSKYE
jgi:hypothetical protein